MSSWATAIGSIDTSVAIKCGLKLTDDQYEGLRRLISYKFNSETGRHEIKIEAQTGIFLVRDNYSSVQETIF